MSTFDIIFLSMGLFLFVDATWRYFRLPRKNEQPVRFYNGSLHLLAFLGGAGYMIEKHFGLFDGRIRLGGLLVVVGFVIVLWGRITLKSHWSPHIYTVYPNQLISNGPYRWLRHPIYIGEAITSVGLAIYFISASLMVFLVFGGSLYNYYRSRLE